MDRTVTRRSAFKRFPSTEIGGGRGRGVMQPERSRSSAGFQPRNSNPRSTISVVCAAAVLIAIITTMAGPARADALGDAEAAYRDGHYALAFELFKPLADAGSVEARLHLAELYSGREGVKPDHATAFELFKALAAEGVPAGEAGMGQAYYTGFGAPRDLDLAVHWLSLAAAHGDPRAQMLLGGMYMNGERVKRDHRQGIQLIRSAADAGSTSAQYLLGMYYENGVGLPLDRVQALKWYLISSQRRRGQEETGAAGDAEARAYLLANMMGAADVDRASALARDWKPGLPADSY